MGYGFIYNFQQMVPGMECLRPTQCATVTRHTFYFSQARRKTCVLLVNILKSAYGICVLPGNSLQTAMASVNVVGEFMMKSP